MRWIKLALIALILLLQYPLWLGKGSWLKVWDLNRQVEAQKQTNQQAQTRNAVLDAEVRDLKQGTEAIEERARSELGMVKRGEIFFQVAVGETPQLPASGVRDAKP
ncbi:MAG: cell division protein FtsB [Nitrosomonadales bacterium]|nr:cell division protein FtsB [Nitrosomonadales bacterium]